MSEKKPDTPVVHLPWSHWQDITARLEALEAALTDQAAEVAWLRAELERVLAPAMTAEASAHDR